MYSESGGGGGLFAILLLSLRDITVGEDAAGVVVFDMGLPIDDDDDVMQPVRLAGFGRRRRDVVVDDDVDGGETMRRSPASS